MVFQKPLAPMMGLTGVSLPGTASKPFLVTFDTQIKKKVSTLAVGLLLTFL